jgi:hypothetical protein
MKGKSLLITARRGKSLMRKSDDVMEEKGGETIELLFFGVFFREKETRRRSKIRCHTLPTQSVKTTGICLRCKS